MFTGADAKLKDLSHLNQYNIDSMENAKPANPVRELCDLCEQAGTNCQNALFLLRSCASPTMTPLFTSFSAALMISVKNLC